MKGYRTATAQRVDTFPLNLPPDIVSKLIVALRDSVDELNRENDYLTDKVHELEERGRKRVPTTTGLKKRKFDPMATRFAGSIAHLPQYAQDTARTVAKANGYATAIEWVKAWREENKTK